MIRQLARLIELSMLGHDQTDVAAGQSVSIMLFSGLV
jgi:hypothetical protein